MASQADEMVSQDLEQVFFQMGWPSVKPEPGGGGQDNLEEGCLCHSPHWVRKECLLPVLTSPTSKTSTRLRSKHCSCRYSAESFNERSGKTLKNRPKPA